MKLYELNEAYNNLMALLEEADDDLKEIVKTSLDELEMNIDDKIENTIKYIRMLEADVQAYKTEIDRLSKNKKVLDNRIDSLKEYLLYNVKNSNKKQYGTFKVSVRKSTSVNVLDSELIPIEYKKYTESIDKTLIKQDIKKGLVIEGIEIKENESINIK